MIGRLFPAVLMATRNLTRTKIRSALAALGIVIGVIAIASLGMLGATLRQQATQNLGDIGNQVIVQPSNEADESVLDERQVQEIRRIARDAEVVPVASTFETASFGSEDQRVQTYRLTAPPSTYEARAGRIPDPLRNGALVGVTVAESFGVEPGNAITVNGTQYRVRAVVEGTGGPFSSVNPDNAVVVPKRTRGGYSEVVVTADSGRRANETAMAIEASLNGREEAVDVRELASITENIGEFFNILNMFLIGVGSISLLVAGVSILNVMLMSAVERREEIGVLRAVGFQKLDVLRIMLTEAALLGVVGGAVGALVSLAVGAGAAQWALNDATIVLQPANLQYLPIGFGFGLITSIVSGLYPAWKAANERPVDALRG